MPATIISNQQAKTNKVQEAKQEFLADLKRRSFSSKSADEVRQIAASNQSAFSAPRLRAFVSSSPALDTLRFTCEEEF